MVDTGGCGQKITTGDTILIPSHLKAIVQNGLKCCNIYTHGGDGCTIAPASIQLLPWCIIMQIWEKLRASEKVMMNVMLFSPVLTGLKHSIGSNK
jgi:hypothetical protein